MQDWWESTLGRWESILQHSTKSGLVTMHNWMSADHYQSRYASALKTRTAAVFSRKLRLAITEAALQEVFSY